jgi:transcriptional regulator with XRE-family HTH domain
MPEPTSDAELLYRKVVHLLQHGFRTATYKLATMTALVEFSSENLAKRSPAGELRVPITELAQRVIALYWAQVRPFDGQILKQSTQSGSRILEAVVALQLVASPHGGMSSVDEAAQRAPEMYRRTLDTVGITLAQQPLPRLQRKAGAPQSLAFLYDDSFLHDKVSRAVLETHGNAVQLKPGIAERLATAKKPLLRTLTSMWIDDVLRMNGIPAEGRLAVAHHMFGPEYQLNDLASVQQPEHSSEQESEEQPGPALGVPIPSPSASFAERLNFLFDSFHPDSVCPYSTAEVARQLRGHGYPISATYLANLRLGLQDNPSRSTMRGLAQIFETDLAFLLGDDRPGLTDREVDRIPENVDDEQDSNVTNSYPMPSQPAGRHRAVVDDETDHSETPVVRGAALQLPTDISVSARQLNKLFELHLGPDGEPFTNSQVATSLQEDGLPITDSLISRLRTGSGSVPSLQTLDALAYFFNVDVDYFTAGNHSNELKDLAVEVATPRVVPRLRDDRLDPQPTRPNGGLRVSTAMLSDVISGLSDAAGTYLERGTIHTNDCRNLLQTLGTIGSCLTTAAGQDISISEQLLERIVSGWAPMIAIDDARYRTFRQLADVRGLPTAKAAQKINDRREEGDPGQSDRWTRESFVDAVKDPSDQAFLAKLLGRFDKQSEILGSHAPLWYGFRPGGGLFLHPFRLPQPPFQLLLDAAGRLTVRGNWRTFSKVAGHAGFAELAAMLGQDESGPASSVPVEGLDADALWDVAERTARVINT